MKGGIYFQQIQIYIELKACINFKYIATLWIIHDTSLYHLELEIPLDGFYYKGFV